MAVDNQTIIIKKIKKGGHGHHGGAWKVAYADFVTAMMAFFLLLWLLSSTSEAQKKGIADYFTPTIGLKDEMGIGVEGGLAPVEDGTSRSELMPIGMTPGQVPQGPISDVPKESEVDGDADAKLFEKAQEALKQAMESDPNLREFTENIVMEQTPEGLKLELRDSDKNPMYLVGSEVLSDAGQKILRGLLPLIRKMPNQISITGHTDASPLGREAYTNWELSAGRANSARRFLVAVGLSDKRVGKVVGRADAELALPETPTAPQNRRMEIILLKGSHLNLLPQQQVLPRSLMTLPRATDTLKKLEQRLENQDKAKVKADGKPLPSEAETNKHKQQGLKEH
jgi:chemotaxis protein MotB